jgi:Fe2+ or Zn2+ uptake regulation protein
VRNCKGVKVLAMIKELNGITLTWLELDDLTDSISTSMPNANRSNVYRTLVHFGIFIVEKKLICYGNYHPNLGGV